MIATSRGSSGVVASLGFTVLTPFAWRILKTNSVRFSVSQNTNKLKLVISWGVKSAGFTCVFRLLGGFLRLKFIAKDMWGVV